MTISFLWIEPEEGRPVLLAGLGGGGPGQGGGRGGGEKEEEVEGNPIASSP